MHLRKTDRLKLQLSTISLVVASSLGLYLLLSSDPVSASTTSAIEQTISTYENNSVAIFSPLATSPTQNSACELESCVPLIDSASNSTEADQQFSDNLPNVADLSNWRTNEVNSGGFNLSVLEDRNSLAMLGLADQHVTGPSSAATKFLTSEESLLQGNTSRCNVTVDCTFTSAAGATVLSFSNESVNGANAQISAVIKGWQTMAPVDSSGVIGPWHTAVNELDVTYSLVEQSDGSWVIDSRVGDFVPGFGP